ncbi:YfdX family protein [Candidatus Paracaedibacter symbiosus]|uniref:YfdX family protein n=1 Tax=Candidatus Paracaedibacter symbiosus TaxID=244582 RepID=UPI00050989A6|nr:YfdX family protein [Candidatus Paracaedibacter symbiosus]
MYKYVFTRRIVSLKLLGASLALSLYISTPYAQDTLTAISHFQDSHVQNEGQVRTEIDQQRRQAEEQAQKSLVPEAIVVIEETKKAIDSLTKMKDEKEALEAIERATGKINILLARHPATALLPIGFKVEVIDTAPSDIKIIKKIIEDINKEMKNKNYPETRLLLDILRSEINVRIYHLPLAIYPAALKEAARLLDQKQTNESITVLATALNTLVIINQSLPIPTLVAKVLITEAEEKQKREKETSLKLIAKARYELKRANELGYAQHDQDYTLLKQDLEKLEQHVKSTENNTSVFAAIKEKFRAFFKRHFETKTPPLHPEQK